MIIVVLFLIAGVFHHNGLASEVSETSENYDCTEEKQNLRPQLLNDFTGCENTWTVGRTTIAKTINDRAECHRPCSEVTPSGIVLDSCVNITLTVFCTKEYTSEYRMHFIGKMNIPPPLQDSKGRACYGLLACPALLLPVALGWILQRRRSSLNHERRNAGLSEV
ncbi:hypothetical protein AMEX_G8409 [Astyanax mexicanus]|uniref:Uncharacterized protein n=1 Tax=Astyanax mexicanus TaxID=7994 RepID=A0A8T2LWN6_ASTMX|nr:hypothetical protein AMEX_G8409 [Astyanax mexicanus]